MKIFMSKRKIVILTLATLLSTLLLFQLHSNEEISKINSLLFITPDDFANEIPSEPLIYECCTQLNKSIRTNVYFLKTHKTGGTTVQSVILRFAVMNSLDVMSTNYQTYYWPFSDASIHSEIWTPNGKFNILASHMRYDSKLKSYQYPDTSMVTILRHPATLFQSLYTFFRMDQTTGMTFQQFLNAPQKPESVRGFNSEIAYRGYNQMSVDLGFDLKQKNNSTAVEEFVAKIDREFDFVMMTEYMDESFVLLANLMGWPLEYVASLKLNARLPEDDPYSLTLQDEITLLELNHVDAVLYDHFSKKFRKCMRQYGEQKLNDKVQQLKIINEQFKKRCVAEEVVRFNLGFLERIEYKEKNTSDLECHYSMQVSPVLAPMIRKWQTDRLRQLNGGSTTRRNFFF